MEDLPGDAFQAIVLHLDVEDTVQLGACSRALASACNRADLWHTVYESRWGQDGKEDGSAELGSSGLAMDWRCVVTQRHLAAKRQCTAVALDLEGFLAGSTSVEAFEYAKCLQKLQATELSFGDVRRFLLAPSCNVLLNLLGLHYCIQSLDVEASEIVSTLRASGISDRVACSRVWMLGPWAPQGFRLKDVMVVSRVLLADLALPGVVKKLRQQAQLSRQLCHGVSQASPLPKDEARTALFLERIIRGTVHEIMRIQISADFDKSAWTGRDMHSQR